jgi:CheY-like chemotaxis protein
VTRKGKAISNDETVPMLGDASRGESTARYRLRAAAHRITADGERLYGAMSRAEQHAWRTAIGRALLASRHLESIIAREPAGALATLRQAIAPAQSEIVDALSALLALIPTDLDEELILADVSAIREMAVGLGSTYEAHPAVAGRGAVVPAADDTPEGARTRVLVVDDEAPLRQVLVRMLQRLGYDTLEAPDGRAALELAEREAPDLVITDLTMPHMTGHDLLRRLKADERTRHVPVIVVSGEGDSASVVSCLEQGAEDHVTKPYEAVVLQARVRSTLERKRLRDGELTHLRRVAQLTAAAEAVEHHRYEPASLRDLVGRPDPLGQLARVFDRMVTGLRAREEQLEARLRQLRRDVEQVSMPGAATDTVSEESHFAVGDILAGRYEIKRELGKGGMGLVYLAHDRELREDVAVKLVRSDLIREDPSLLERLRSEARLARKISHRNVVRTHDLGEWQGVYFVTMEYVKGVTVADLIAVSGKLAVPSVLAIGTQLADALAVAHAEQIIHRDIKPQNLLVDQNGVLKVTDFGLARPVKQTAGVTLGGYIVGTPNYMAPEQLFGGDVDGRTDLFAVGVVLYECLTGNTPFEADSPMGVAARIMSGPPRPIDELTPGVPPALAAVIEHLLQREPSERLRSARDLAERLAHVGQIVG